MRRGEIYTAYTSYQPEISQGLLQLVFEYESQLAELTGMDVINASMYDWGSALGELVRMLIRIKRGRDTVLIIGPISERRLEVLKSYTLEGVVKIEYIDSNGDHNFEKANEIMNADAMLHVKERKIAGIYFEVPTYHGVLPSKVPELVESAHNLDILVGVGCDILSLGVIEAPGDYGADFIIGEGQILGNPISSGGPLLGILGSKYNRNWLQNFPGRLVGLTKDFRDNDPAYCITLSTREQHIRREKATSNICTNQTLMAIIAGIYLSGLGPKGIQEQAQYLRDKAVYLAKELNKIDKVTAPLYGPFFCDFVVEFHEMSNADLEKMCFEKGIIPGIKLDSKGCQRLIGLSESISKSEIDKFVEVIKEYYKNEN